MPIEPNNTGHPDQHRSLLDDETSSVGVARPTRGIRPRLQQFERSTIDRFNRAWARPGPRLAIMAVSSVGALALGLGIYLAIRPVPKPDYETADLGIAFNYTLLTEEFNSLPVEERIDLVAQLYGRVRDMDAAESAVMAAFFAGVSGEARDQLERNAGKLLVDAADMVAVDYSAVPPEQRDEYLDDAYVRLVRLTAPFDSSIADRTDEEILERGRRDATRGQEDLESGEISAEQASRLMLFMDRQSRQSSSVAQQQRLSLFMRDMTRRLRGSGG